MWRLLILVSKSALACVSSLHGGGVINSITNIGALCCLKVIYYLRLIKWLTLLGWFLGMVFGISLKTVIDLSVEF